MHCYLYLFNSDILKLFLIIKSENQLCKAEKKIVHIYKSMIHNIIHNSKYKNKIKIKIIIVKGEEFSEHFNSQRFFLSDTKMQHIAKKIYAIVK